MNSKIDVLITWMMLLVASLAEVPLWLKISLYSIGVLVGFTVIIRFFIDWKNGNFKKSHDKTTRTT